MKRMIFSLLALCAAVPAMAVEPVEMSGLGLSGFEAVSEETGMEVRGLSSNAHSSGLTTIRAFAIDPATGSTFNANASNFAKSSQDGAVAANSDASSNTFAGFNALVFAVGGNTIADLSGSGASSGLGTTQDITGSAFNFTASGFTFSPTAPL